MSDYHSKDKECVYNLLTAHTTRPSVIRKNLRSSHVLFIL